MDPNGKVALITGAGSGIGRATALLLAENGVSVVVADVDESGGHETVAAVKAVGGAAACVRAEVASCGEVVSVSRLGGGPTSWIWTLAEAAPECSGVTVVSGIRRQR